MDNLNRVLPGLCIINYTWITRRFGVIHGLNKTGFVSIFGCDSEKGSTIFMIEGVYRVMKQEQISARGPQ